MPDPEPFDPELFFDPEPFFSGGLSSSRAARISLTGALIIVTGARAKKI